MLELCFDFLYNCQLKYLFQKNFGLKPNLNNNDFNINTAFHTEFKKLNKKNKKKNTISNHNGTKTDNIFRCTT